MGFLSNLLKTLSGNTGMKMSEQLLFDKIIGFRGIVPGVGTSTIVQNVAIALSARTNYSICVLDTHFLYPTIYPMLMSGADSKRKDYLEFSGDLSEIVLQTAYRNVSLVSLNNRTIIDMMSSRDSELTVEKLVGALKSYFDVILVDLSYEPTNLYAHTAIKCNRIINVADYSLKCIYNLRKSLNTMATLAVPFAKANKVVVNKVLPDILTNINGVLSEAGLKIIGEIPYSMSVAKLGLAGKRIWSTSTSNKEIYIFSSVIDAIINDILEVTPLNESYIKEKPDGDYPSEDIDNVSMQPADNPVNKKKKEDTSESQGKDKKSKGLFGRGRKTKDEPITVDVTSDESASDETKKSDAVEVEVPVVDEGSSEVVVLKEASSEEVKSSSFVEDDIEEELVVLKDDEDRK